MGVSHFVVMICKNRGVADSENLMQDGQTVERVAGATEP
jgi:hypothetical protein